MPQWGNAIHEIIEHLVKDEFDNHDYKRHILSQYGFSETEHIERADRLIKDFKESSLYSRIQNS